MIRYTLRLIPCILVLTILLFTPSLNSQEEVEDYFEKWLNEDVVYIIAQEERDVFNKLGNPDEKEQFIEQFWIRRDPTPDSIENEYREEHYRRIAYANDRYASGIPGWKTDRGHVLLRHALGQLVRDQGRGRARLQLQLALASF